MSQSLKSVQEHLDEAAPTDVTAVFGDWQELVERLKAKVAARFELRARPVDRGARGLRRRTDGPRRPGPRPTPDPRSTGWCTPTWRTPPRASATCT